MVIGIGAGQQNRVKSVEIAIENAEKFGFSLDNAVLISDGFFPFADSIEMIKDTGIKTVVQPGGSKRDNEVISACKKYNIELCITNARHFRH
jgi:phosphoribosylaminoimidazolecarboxamide formyltransferase/IMP cyclohydrolase